MVPVTPWPSNLEIFWWAAVATWLALLTTACTPPPPATPTQEVRPPIHSAAAGEAVTVTVTVDQREVNEVRLYFKPMSADEYVYLKMAATGENSFSAQLPPARESVKGLDYLLLFLSEGGVSRRTKPFRLLILKSGQRVAPTPKEPVAVHWEGGAVPIFDQAFAVPLQYLPSPAPLLADAEENTYPTIVPGSSTITSLTPFPGPGGFSFSLKVGGFGLFYGGR